MRVRLFGIVLLALCLVSPVFAADRVIQNGIDVWVTKGNGSTIVDFAEHPLPAGFLCRGSAPFTGKVAFRGEPIVTGTPGALGKTDTIVQRLDDAEFDRRGVAVTRIQFRALSLKSVQPIQTSCGKFDATVTLDGVQPITRMRIVRENENGGRFFAPLALNTKVSFTPLGRVSPEVLEVAVPVRFPAMPISWRDKSNASRSVGSVLVDTNGDRSPDTYLPGTSNFLAGRVSRPVFTRRPGLIVGTMPTDPCHRTSTQTHCVYTEEEP